MFTDMAINWLEKALAFLYGSPADKSEAALDLIMTAEVNAMNRALYDLGIGAEIRKQDIIYSSTGNFIRYRVSGPGIKLSTVQSYSGDLQAAINDSRRTIPGAAKVIVKWRDGLSFDVPYPLETTPLLWEKVEAVKSVKPFQAIVGRNYEAEEPYTEILDYNDESVAHVLVSGGSGSGKSVMLINLILSLAWSTPPDKILFIILDTKMGPTIKPLAGLPNVILCSEVDECIAAVSAVQAELERRKREGKGDTKVFLILEELADMMIATDDPDALWKPLIRLSCTSREFGLHMIACTQYANVKTVVAEFRTNFLTRLGGQFATDGEGSVATGRQDLKCSMLPGKGAFYFVHQLKVARIQTMFLKGDALAKVIADIAAKWKGIEPYLIPMTKGCIESPAALAAALNKRKPSKVADEPMPDESTPADEPVGNMLDEAMVYLADLAERYGNDMVSGWVALAIDDNLSSKVIMNAAKVNGSNAGVIRRKIDGVVGVVKNSVCGVSPE